MTLRESLLAIILLLLPPSVSAQQRTESASGSSESSQTLEQRVQALEKALAKSEQEKQAAKEKAAEEKAEAERIKRQWVDVSNDKWDVKLGGHFQLDYVTWAQADPAIDGDENYFSYRRLRLLADGEGYGLYDFRLQMTLEPGQGLAADRYATPDVKDAYFSINEIPGLGRFRIGNFFVPFTLEQSTTYPGIIFAERAIPSQGVFAFDREVGMALYNHTEDKNITWNVGVFFDNLNDTFKTRIDDNQGLRLSGRATWLPYYDEPSEGRYMVHTGIGILHTEDHDDRVRFRTRPHIHRGPFMIDSGVIESDSYTISNLELALVWGNVSLQSEAFLANVNRLDGGNNHFGGVYVYGSWFLTGENRRFSRFGSHGAQFAPSRPFTNFFITPGGIGWGAWEAKARWSYLDLTDTNSGQYNDLTVGLNWYWTDRTRLLFDWTHPMTTDETVFGSTTADILTMRFDVTW